MGAEVNRDLRRGKAAAASGDQTKGTDGGSEAGKRGGQGAVIANKPGVKVGKTQKALQLFN